MAVIVLKLHVIGKSISKSLTLVPSAWLESVEVIVCLNQNVLFGLNLFMSDYVRLVESTVKAPVAASSEVTTKLRSVAV